MSVDVLVCNLTRFGDLVQTQPLLDDLRVAGLSAGLVCLDNFSAATSMLRNVDQVWPLRGGAIMSSLESSWPTACANILQFASQVREEGRPRHILNLTPTLPARLLARLFASSGATLMGFGLDEYGYVLNGGVWASFISVAARQRMNAPFNLSDMLRKMATPLTGGARGDYRLSRPDAKANQWAEEFLRETAARHKPCGFVAFQPGASNNNRQWPIDNFRILGQQLWDEAHLVPVILGTASESRLAGEYAHGCSHPFVDATGKTNLFQLGALLRMTKLLVTNDTGTMHLASGQDVPSLAFFMATAQPWDTGPLKPGCCCLEPALPCHPCSFGQKCGSDNVCRQKISPQSAADLVLGWLETGDWRSGMSERVQSECRVWQTYKEDDGLTSVKLLGVAKGERDLWLPLLRVFWSQLLDELENPAGKNSDSSLGFSDLKVPMETAEIAISALEQSAVILESIYACGAAAGKSAQARQLLLKNGQRLQTMLQTCQPLSTVCEFWREFTHNQFEKLEAFLPATLVIARHMREFSAFLGNKIHGI